MTLLLVHTAHVTALEHAGPGFGRLLSPRDCSRARDTAAAGIPWAADNDCFQGLDEPAFVRMLASLVAFLTSELLELALFTPLRRRHLTAAVALSATAGNALDSYLFLAIAFGSQAFWLGNFVGKLEMIAVGVALTAGRRKLAPVAA